jgi:hypothetical protein
MVFPMPKISSHPSASAAGLQTHPRDWLVGGVSIAACAFTTMLVYPWQTVVIAEKPSKMQRQIAKKLLD